MIKKITVNFKANFIRSNRQSNFYFEFIREFLGKVKKIEVIREFIQSLFENYSLIY
jgi:hypothetical protein